VRMQKKNQAFALNGEIAGFGGGIIALVPVLPMDSVLSSAVLRCAP
jgi:hypothetical protein